MTGWAKTTDDGYCTDVAIFDFSKAFDSEPHKWLLYKLQYNGIRGTYFVLDIFLFILSTTKSCHKW